MKSSFDSALFKKEQRRTGQREALNDSRNINPGPGNYSPSTKISKLSAPKYGFGSEPKMKKIIKYQSPSPSQYKIKDSITKRSFQSTGMGYGKKVDPTKVLHDTPGPGSYVRDF